MYGHERAHVCGGQRTTLAVAPQVLPMLGFVFEIGSLINLELAQSARLAGK